MVGGIEELENLEKTRLNISHFSQSAKRNLSWLLRDPLSLILLIFAITSFAYGVWLSQNSIHHQHYSSTHPIVVDIGGAVKKPGIYSCQQGERVIDLIEKAGGLDKQADLYWVDSTLNKARFLVDGEKVYIPFRSAYSHLPTNKISLNYATLEELDALPGIGKTTAQKIISNRPYSKLEEVVEKGVISQKVWQMIKRKISL